MATHNLRFTDLGDSAVPCSNRNTILDSHGVNPAPPSSSSLMHSNQGGSAFDFGVLEHAMINLQGVVDQMGHPQHHIKPSALYAANRGSTATLEMFPCWPITFQQATTVNSNAVGESDSGSACSLNTDRDRDRVEAESTPFCSAKAEAAPLMNQQLECMGSDISSAGPSPNQPPPTTSNSKQSLPKRQGGAGSEKVLDSKALRRLAQNREAARKCRIRKKAYVQQLETSRIRLAQLEQDLQRARSQGLLLGGPAGVATNISSGAAIFDMEYGRWLEDDQRHLSELRAGMQSHVGDVEFQGLVDSYLRHYDEIFQLKNAAAKSDVFHLITGLWASPAERCFLWMGGFRPSDLIKMLMAQLDTFTEQQFMGLYSLQQSSQQAEDALSQGLDQLQQSLVDTVAGVTAVDGMHQMAVALGKLSNLEGFVRQADYLRQQTLQQLCRILTVRQVARCFLVMGEYYNRLRALSQLWASRPRESMISGDSTCQTSDVQMVHPSQNHFPPL